VQTGTRAEVSSTNPGGQIRLRSARGFAATLSRGAAAATVKDREKGRAAFVRQVGWGFDRSKESVVYGPAPRFDDVFAPSSPEMAFHALFERLFTITGRYMLS
jgi:hypothetical protein